jgi:ribosomal protein S18 acetylase RimI-like enzyme
MPRHDPAIQGPEPATLRDIDALNQLFSQAFTDRYQRDGMSGVRVPFLNPQVWRYALEGAGPGALVWREGSGGIAAFNIAHCSGTEGWMGPLAVRTNLQGQGLGTRVVRAGIEHLRAQGATTIGLETMPRTVDNIGFYSQLGFRPGHLTVTVSREPRERAPGPGRRLSAAGPDAPGLREGCRALTARVRPGADYIRELDLTAERHLGDTTVIAEQGVVQGFALWQGAALAAGRPSDELRVLKVVARDLAVFGRLVEALEAAAVAERLGRLTFRAETAATEAFGLLVREGFQVLWTDLRMTLEGYPEVPRGDAVIFSNWEI